MKINWKVRVKNKTFWLTLVPAIFLVIQSVLSLFGIQYDFSAIQTGIATVITAIFGLLAVLGIVTDHTTDGFSDSDQALTYTEPKK